jgi:hypothetical protein
VKRGGSNRRYRCVECRRWITPHYDGQGIFDREVGAMVWYCEAHCPEGAS